MTFVTKLTLQSGDRVVLDETVKDIKTTVARKGAVLKGPHPRPPRVHRVTLSKRLLPTGGQFEPWSYTVYTRDLEIIGYDSVIRSVVDKRFPASLQVSIEVEQIGSAG